MNSIIKLYSKTKLSVKCKTYQETEKRLNQLYNQHIFNEIQKPTLLIQITKRKLNKYNGTLTFYTAKTIQEIIEDNKFKPETDA